jgi:BirA family transcriptional regulator, biotin operon repressor / biotin---[acetyl-CoA-carboxylase] ligase
MDATHDTEYDLDLAAALRRAAPAVPADWRVGVRAQCVSTNSELLAQADDVPAALFALEQTHGRGRRGRDWASRPGDSLTFSLHYRFGCRAAALSGLSLAVGVALADALSTQGTDGIALKWPNDLMRHGGKLGGVLIELASAPAGATSAVIGVGINLAPPPLGEYAHPPASLCAATPARADWLRTGAALLDALARALPYFAAHGFEGFVDRWNGYNLHAGRRVNILGERRPLAGICLGADRDGALLLDDGGRIERVLSGDVSLRASD